MQITEKQKQQLIDLNDSRVNEILEFNPYNRWYKWRDSDFLMFIHNEGRYGFDTNGVWRYGKEQKKEYNTTDGYTLATEQEVEQALIDEAKNRGFKKGVKFKDLHINKEATVDEVVYFDYSEDLRAGGYCIFHGGNWAEIIDDKAELKEEIKELRKKLKSLEEKL